MSTYLDTNILVALFTDDALSQRADEIVDVPDELPIVSDFAAVEFSSVLARHVRTGELSIAEVEGILSDFDAWAATESARVEVRSEDIRQADGIVRRLDLALRAPDAIHIAIAQRLNAELATFDEQMAICARTLGAPVRSV